jgi:hypothetical protein
MMPVSLPTAGATAAVVLDAVRGSEVGTRMLPGSPSLAWLGVEMTPVGTLAALWGHRQPNTFDVDMAWRSREGAELHAGSSKLSMRLVVLHHGSGWRAGGCTLVASAPPCIGVGE